MFFPFNLKIHDITAWLTNNNNTQDTYCPTSHEVKATRN